MRLETISKLPSGVAHPTPLLFVHGVWCWDQHFLDYFTGHGFAAHALNLRGHGKFAIIEYGLPSEGWQPDAAPREDV